MINTDIIWIPAYTTRDIVNFGLHKAGTIYKYKFTPQDRNLLINGAIKLIPTYMCKYTVTRDIILDGKKYLMNSDIVVNSFDEKVLDTLLKTGTITCEIKEEFKDKDVIALAKIYGCIGKTFKKISQELNIDFDIIKEKFELKQGGANKKLLEKDIDLLKELI